MPNLPGCPATDWCGIQHALRGYLPCRMPLAAKYRYVKQNTGSLQQLQACLATAPTSQWSSLNSHQPSWR